MSRPQKRAETELSAQPEVLARCSGPLERFTTPKADTIRRKDPARLSRKLQRLYGDSSHETSGGLNLSGEHPPPKGAHAEAEALFRKNLDIERKQAQRGHLDVRGMAHALAGYGDARLC